MYKVLVIKNNDKDTFCCSVCGDSFTGKLNYAQHMSTHSRDELLSFIYVVKAPSDKEAFQDPITEQRFEGPQTCSVCLKVCKSLSVLQNHMRTHTGEKPFSCCICEKRFSSKYLVKGHKARHHNERLLTCDFCQKTFVRRGNFTSHLLSVHKVEQRKLFSKEVEKERKKEEKHVILHAEKQIVKQMEEEVKEEDETQDEKHTEKQEKETEKQGPIKPFSCNDYLKTDLTEPIKFVQDFEAQEQARKQDGRKFICGICDVSFFWKYQLLCHMRIHLGHVLCQICDMTFRSKDLLTSHMELHTRRKHDGDSEGSSAPRIDKPFTCTECDKAFVHKRSLIVHMRVHTDEGVYSCNVCQKSFHYLSTLRKHMRHKIHMDVLNTSCRICSKTFFYRSGLSSHMQIHTSRKTFSCCFCYKPLEKSWQLFDENGSDGRICTVCKQVSLSCVLCNKVVKLSSLRKHLGQHTGEFNTDGSADKSELDH